MSFRSRRNPGFALIELLVVVAILSLLMAILVPSLRKARVMTMRLRCGANLKQIDLAVRMYVDDNDGVYPCAQDPVSTDPFYWLWMGRGWRPMLEGYLGGAVDVNNPSVLLCPQDRTDPVRYESTSYAYSMAFYHSREQIDSLSHQSQTYTDPLPPIKQRPENVARPDGKILIGEWFSNHEPVDEEKGWWNWEGARNFLMADGQVVYLAADQILPANDDLPDANLTIRGIKGRDRRP